MVRVLPPKVEAELLALALALVVVVAVEPDGGGCAHFPSSTRRYS